MNYSDKHLQDHELGYWINSFNLPFIHESFYKGFFNFNELNNKKVVEIGCGGCPITEYNKLSLNLTLVEPLLDKLIEHSKYKHLKEHNLSSISLFDFDKTGYDYLVCLNVIDHFNDSEYTCIDKFSEILNDKGEMWVYYDIRDKNDGDHLAINNEKLMNKIKSKFDIKKIDTTLNPSHRNWASVNKSIRIIATKK